jgi:hypothetical protein
MVFSGTAESEVVGMCKMVGEQIKVLTGDANHFKELAPKARFFILAIKDAMSARSGSAQEIAYLFLSRLFPSSLDLPLAGCKVCR